MRYFIEFSYKGTAYHGWQRQNNAIGVQEILEQALGKILREPVAITGSSRTDTGVHATQQFAHFDRAEGAALPPRLVYRLNGLLPDDIAVAALHRVDPELNSRFVATHRRYEYRISRTKNPFLHEVAYGLSSPVDVDRMNAAAKGLLGLHDFESFSKVHTNVNNFRCTITRAEWEVRGDLWIFHIQANRFLRGMVRAVVGTLLDIGRGKRSVENMKEVIEARNRKFAGPQAPAEGLFLVEVGYPEGLFLETYRD
ncbi:tRNA pseudouridine38-40 synthase [Dyadobacter jejuensis]|uniref:tRNA pseudouridine synthase A n=1 Tax=Dyadobacter jejuensis TaxID=1082580 RepID=A0A316AG36_9BACT|nr:tRNA pseudouridine(38-40) synthase TruA [Dyadobacter jejuensis]PWJ55930.1 tRNA pseudouridine38-40 synthase [Dyadobacter jejuensis]